METRCVNGTNILSEVEIKEHGMRLNNNGKQVLDLDFEKITNVNVIRNDLILEMGEEHFKKFGLNLAEVRFHVPNTEEEGTKNSADVLKEKISKYIKEDSSKQDKLYQFENLSFLVPRGKYYLIILKNFFKLHGFTYNYNIKYSNIVRCFMLPMPDNINLMFVFAFKKPIEQGRTWYKHMIIQFSMDKETRIEALTQERNLKAVSDNLKEEYTGKLFETFSSVFQTVCKTNIIIPDPDFETVKQTNGIPCSVKAHQGVLFILKKSLIYLHKPAVVHIKYSAISMILLYRLNNTSVNKGFDLEVISKEGQKTLFGDISTADADNLVLILKKNGAKVEKAKDKDEISNDEYDSDEKSIKSIEDEDIKDGFVESDDDSSEDDDFVPSKLKKSKKSKKSKQ